MTEELDIYQYTNYRKFLQDFYDSEKERNPEKFSFRYFAKRAGFSTSNFLYLVMHGKRNLSFESIHRFARAIGLGSRETLFFESLVHYNQVADPIEKSRAFEKLLSFREYRQAKKLTKEEYEYFSRWYFAVIRELIALPEFQESPAWIVKKLRGKISREEARLALRKLLELGLINRGSSGRLRQADQNLATDEEISSAALFRFHNEMIEKGRESLALQANEREVSALTMSLSKGQFEEIRKKIQELHRDVQRLIADNGQERPTTVCQLNFQLFNVTTPERSER